MRAGKKAKVITLSLAFCLGLASPAWPGDNPWALSGSAETYTYLVGRQPLGGLSGDWLSYSPFRLRILYKPDSIFTVEAAEELDSIYQSGVNGSISAFLQPVSTYRLFDFSNPLVGTASGEGERLMENLDRLSVSFHLDKWDFIVGRQVVSFGSARIVNPTDVLAPFNLETLDQENRSGVDALRVRYAWGDFGELDGGWVAGKDARWDLSAIFLRPRFRLGATDVSLLGMIFMKNALAGLDLQGSLGGAGWWLEGAWVWPQDLGDPYGRLATGMDYYFTGDVDGTLEYHFNGAGKDTSSQYLDLNPTAYGSGTVYLLGRHYLAPGLSWQATALLAIKSQAMVNLEDGSCWFLFHAEYNALENLYVDLGLAQPLGAGPNGFVPQSEFGLYPAFQYAALRFYF